MLALYVTVIAEHGFQNEFFMVLQVITWCVALISLGLNKVFSIVTHVH